MFLYFMETASIMVKFHHFYSHVPFDLKMKDTRVYLFDIRCETIH